MRAVDLHAPFGASLHGHPVTRRDMLRGMDRLGIAVSALVPQKPPGYRLGPATRAALAAAARHPDRFRAWARVDPWQPGAAAELAEALDRGACGLFLHPLEELFPVNDPRLDPLLGLCGARRVPAMVAGGHVRYSTAWQIGELAARHPGVTIVATSGGQINISGIALGEAETMLAEHANVLMETSGIYREDFIEDMAKRFGAGRILFGSGAPPYDKALELHRGLWAHLPELDRARILAGNAERLLKLPRRE